MPARLAAERVSNERDEPVSNITLIFWPLRYATLRVCGWCGLDSSISITEYGLPVRADQYASGLPRQSFGRMMRIMPLARSYSTSPMWKMFCPSRPTAPPGRSLPTTMKATLGTWTSKIVNVSTRVTKTRAGPPTPSM